MLHTISKALTLAVLSTWVITSNGNLIRPRESNDVHGLQLFHASYLAPRAGGGGRGGKNGHPDGGNSPQGPDSSRGGGAGEQTGDEGGFSNPNEGGTEGGFTTCKTKRSWPGTLFWRRAGCATDPQGRQDTPSDISETELELYDNSRDRGRSAINHLEEVLGQSPLPSHQIPKQEMESKYEVKVDTEGLTVGKFPEVLRKLRNYENGRDWTTVRILNTPENIKQFDQNSRARIQNDANIVDKVGERKVLEDAVEQLKENPMLAVGVNIEKKALVLPWSYNRKWDLYRNWDDDSEGLRRIGLDNDGAMKFTDQIMSSLDSAAQQAGKNVKDVELEYVVRTAITTDDTNNVIEVAMEKARKRYEDSPNRVVEFQRGDEGFEAIMGTIHGERILQMLSDYADVLGSKISKLSIYMGPNPEVDAPDIALHLEKITRKA